MMNAVVILMAGLAGLALTRKEAISAEITSRTDAFTRWDSEFHRAARVHGVPWRWIKSVAWVESDLGQAASVVRGMQNPSDAEASKSSDGKSWGVMQITLATASDLRPGTTVADLNRPEYSIDLGAKNIARLMRIFPADRESTIRAYNGGPGFARTVQGQRDTPAYYAKFQTYLSKILDRQPGDEREI